MVPRPLRAAQEERKRRLAALDTYFEDVPAPELVLALVPAEVGTAPPCVHLRPQPTLHASAPLPRLPRLTELGCCACRMRPRWTSTWTSLMPR